MKKTQTTRLHAVQMNNYVKIKPEILLTQSGKYITNGTDNKFYQYVKNCYIGSPTLQAIIDGITNYTYADGMKYSNSSLDFSDLLSEDDLVLVCKDLKMQGAYSLQVVYNADKSKIVKLYHLPIESLAIAKQADITDEIEGYYYSFDWNLISTFKPVYIPAFGFGTPEDHTEIFWRRIASPQPLYPLPDYVSGLQSAELEEEMSNYYIKHIKNNFSAGKVININQGMPDSPEVQDEAERAIQAKVRGTSNAGMTIISFNNNKENATTVDNIEITDAYQQFQWLTQNARTSIMLANKVNDPTLFGLPLPSGFSSVADQMIQSLKILYRNQIKPLRKIIVNGLNDLLDYNKEGLRVEFIDFPELRVEVVNPTQPQAQPEAPQTNTTLAVNSIGFDFKGVADTPRGAQMVDQAVRSGQKVYIVSDENNILELISYGLEHNIMKECVFATGSDLNKIAKVQELGLDVFYDDDYNNVVSHLPSIGKQF